MDGEIVGAVTTVDGGTLRIDGGWMEPAASVNTSVTKYVDRDAVLGRPLGSLFGDSQMLVMAILVAPWALGLAIMIAATRWAERIRRHHAGSSRWWPLPVFLWGAGTLIYALIASRGVREDRPPASSP